MKTDSPEFFKFQAQALRSTLPDLCRKEGRKMHDVIRVADALVFDEDIKREPARKASAAHEVGKRIQRLERKAEDPGYPESARRQYQEENAKVEALLASWRAKSRKASDECENHDESQAPGD